MAPQAASLLAEYKRWMNDRLFEAAGKLDAAALAADKGAFFGSILGTLNPIAVADTIWLHRFARHQASFPALGALSSTLLFQSGVDVGVTDLLAASCDAESVWLLVWGARVPSAGT